MSPPALVRNVPYAVTSRGGPVEEDSDEHEGTSARRVLGRVKSKTLRLADAAKIRELSYRQTKRLWKRYRGEGAKGLQLIRKKYSGTWQERFGTTLAAEHSMA